MRERQTIALAIFTIAASAFLLVAMLTAAVRHDCRIPPKKLSIATAMIMELACPDSLSR